jgi:hypothetical protein
MNNHYSSSALSEARRHDLMNEAKGGWLLKQARAEGSTNKPSTAAHSVLPALVIGIALLLGILLLALVTTHPAAASAPTTGPISGKWYGNMMFPNNSVQRIEVNIENCTSGNVCGYVHNDVVQCTWELTFDGRQGETYVFHHSQTLTGGCPVQGTSYYTPQPDGFLLRVHVNPQFTTEGYLKQRPNAGK